MTLKQRIRYLCDGLAADQWLSLDDFRERLSDVSPKGIATYLSKMHRDEQLKRRHCARQFEYRSGARPVVKKAKGAMPRERLGFMALARLEREDPAAYRKAVAADRGA